MKHPYEIVKVDISKGSSEVYRKAYSFETIQREWAKIVEDGIYQVMQNGKVITTKTIRKGKVVEK
jgi:hypothetical protein